MSCPLKFHPEVIHNSFGIHSEYIQLGAKLVISNTFATCKHTLVDANQSQNFEILNSDGVRLAIEARSELEADNVLVAGGISYWSFTGRDPSLSTLESYGAHGPGYLFCSTLPPFSSPNA